MTNPVTFHNKNEKITVAGNGEVDTGICAINVLTD